MAQYSARHLIFCSYFKFLLHKIFNKHVGFFKYLKIKVHVISLTKIINHTTNSRRLIRSGER